MIGYFRGMTIPCARLISCGLLTYLLCGCASVVNGSHEDIALTTTANGKPLVGANCKFDNDRGEWTGSAPGTVNVHRSGERLTVTCTQAGYTAAPIIIESHTSGATWGNIAAGGLVGVVIDDSNGAAYSYPDHVSVPMTPAPAPAPTDTSKPLT
jgi:hypothetical protein